MGHGEVLGRFLIVGSAGIYPLDISPPLEEEVGA
jgi:hypothetical protein